MRIVIAPDSFGGTLSSREAAEAIADGWRSRRPSDEIVLVPLADGGEGLLEVLATHRGEVAEVEVADPLGRPRRARLLLADGEAVVEAAEACGTRLLAPEERDPLRTTTYGVGQLLEAARRLDVGRVVVGLGGSATVDGGAGALAALGFALTTEHDGGLKVGGGELARVVGVAPRWLDPGWEQIEVVVWADTLVPLADAAPVFGPQKGADDEGVARLAAGIDRWADVVERDLAGSWRDVPGSGAAGGLGFALAAGLGADVVAGAPAVAERVGLPAALERADLVVTGEGALDATSITGKVVGHVLAAARARSVDVAAVVGRCDAVPEAMGSVEEAAPSGPSADPAGDVATAAARLADRWG